MLIFMVFNGIIYFVKLIQQKNRKRDHEHIVRGLFLQKNQFYSPYRTEKEKNMNKVMLMGRTTRDAEIRYTQGEKSTAIARFSLAVDRRFKRDNDEQNADFISCIAFGKVAEFLEKFGRKGTKFVVEGRIQTGSYNNKDGQKVYTTDVVVENIEFAESKNSSGSGGSTNQPAPSSSAGDGFMNIPDGIDEELPFN